MSKDFNININNNDEWLTPPEIIKSLGEFDLDPCSPINRPWDTAKKHYNKLDNGFTKKWYGRVWCNPPYGKETFKWLDKLSNHGNGMTLIFARTETIGFHEQVWDKADAVFFFKGRIKFYYVSGEQGQSANAPSCLVAYGENNVQAISDSNLNGKLIRMKGKT
ncbi:MAG: DNA N-6-adenine-methyltransferase [Candidatus Pacebacteria bacterium]|jgi:hypothetical protein|nr:DNA N-6-adenine-methyltransferase [Candidatus Paceibacterota bacterium]|tara:strand:- start:2566 stop:3054 length:489 start_codon:yes stop_codon:yes gene_type:complete